jgi:hypothetical protein
MKIQELRAMEFEFNEKIQAANKDQFQAKRDLDALTKVSVSDRFSFSKIDLFEIEAMRKGSHAEKEKRRQAFENACQQRDSLQLRIKQLEAEKIDLQAALEPIQSEISQIEGEQRREQEERIRKENAQLFTDHEVKKKQLQIAKTEEYAAWEEHGKAFAEHNSVSSGGSEKFGDDFRIYQAECDRLAKVRATLADELNVKQRRLSEIEKEFAAIDQVVNQKLSEVR